MSDQIKKEIIEANRAAWERFYKGVLAIMLMFPANWVGFSEMYYPKYKPSDLFWYLVLIQLLVGLTYFFPDVVRWVMRKIGLNKS